MASLCQPVQQKISCVFMIGVQDNVPSSKRGGQPFRVTALNDLCPQVDLQDLTQAQPTEKLDGTCCLVQEYQGVPWLWARLDRKPNKQGDRKFQRHQRALKEWKEHGQAGDPPPPIVWDPHKDFKEVPATWIPASGIEVVDGFPLPDKIGHTPGWIPLEKKSRQYCWHLTSVDLDLGLGLVLAPEVKDSGEELVVQCRPLSDLCGKTCELIGTNINGNPYGLGSKHCPVHLLVVHGSIPVVCPSPAQCDGAAVRDWFASSEEATEEDSKNSSNMVEGVVWHCPSGALFKLHRHHLGLPWPVNEPRLSLRPVKVDVDGAHYGLLQQQQGDSGSLLSLLATVHHRRTDRLCQLHHLFSAEKS